MTASAPQASDISVSFVLADLKGGGAERMTLKLASELGARGVPTELVLFNAKGELLNEVPAHLKLLNLDTKRSSRSVCALVKYIRQERPSVLFTTLHHTAIAVRTSVALARTDTRLVVRIANHFGDLNNGKAGLYRRGLAALLRWTYRGADLLTTVSEDLRDELQLFLNGVGPKIVTRYNPVVDDAFFAQAAQPAQHKWLQEPRKHPTIVSAGRLVPQKDHLSLLRSFKLVRNSIEAKLIIFGEGPERDALLTAIEELGIGADVDLPGYDPVLPSALAASDLFVLSSKWEGLPGVLIQALALGVPVVSTNCPTGPSEILENGRYGRLVPVGDPQSLAMSILGTLKNPIQVAAATATERFRADDAVSQLAQDLRSLCHEG